MHCLYMHIHKLLCFLEILYFTYVQSIWSFVLNNTYHKKCEFSSHHSSLPRLPVLDVPPFEQNSEAIAFSADRFLPELTQLHPSYLLFFFDQPGRRVFSVQTAFWETGPLIL